MCVQEEVQGGVKMSRVDRIEQILIEYAGDTKGLDSRKCALEVYDIATESNPDLCPRCGADLKVWEYNRLGEHLHFDPWIKVL